MKDLNALNKYRLRDNEIALYGVDGNHENGLFLIHCRLTNKYLKVIASVGEGWEHVSVSTPSRCPTWPEMDFIKRLFFEDTETVMQLHVPVSDWINNHPYCLHIWKPIGLEIPRPPQYMVGKKNETKNI